MLRIICVFEVHVPVFHTCIKVWVYRTLFYVYCDIEVGSMSTLWTAVYFICYTFSHAKRKVCTHVSCLLAVYSVHVCSCHGYTTSDTCIYRKTQSQCGTELHVEVGREVGRGEVEGGRWGGRWGEGKLREGGGERGS